MKYIPRLFTLLLVAVSLVHSGSAQPLHKKSNFTHEDTIRGSITPERAWWDVSTYNIWVAPDFKSKTIRGWNQILFTVKSFGKNKKMQIDLQEPMNIDSAVFEGKKLTYTRKGNAYYINFDQSLATAGKLLKGETGATKRFSIKLFFSGKPREAVNPPWDGGWIWKKDQKGRPWMTVACQGLGASVWYPCKDYQGDEPDDGALLQIKVPDSLMAVGNGRLYSTDDQKDGTTLYTWQVKNPINNYDIVPYIGKYVHFGDTLLGENNKVLSLDYWVLDYNLDKAKKQFGRDVKPMIRAFEYWFGPYPFYEDGYKLVESSHLGMEHQSATAYGNHYLNGYLGSDLSRTGWGLKWDYIIIHESGHEWFGNNITTNDIADMWVHEGSTMYSEALFVEYYYGKKAADEYVQGIRNNISNDKPLIGPYGVNQEGSGDMYNKGANMLHTIRQVIDNDSIFRSVLRGLNKEFYHKTIDSKDYESYFSKKSGKDLSKIFDQYLRTVKIPELEYQITPLVSNAVEPPQANVDWYSIKFRWNNCVEGFNMPVRVFINGEAQWLKPGNEFQTIKVNSGTGKQPITEITADKNFYITVKKGE